MSGSDSNSSDSLSFDFPHTIVSYISYLIFELLILSDNLTSCGSTRVIKTSRTIDIAGELYVGAFRVLGNNNIIMALRWLYSYCGSVGNNNIGIGDFRLLSQRGSRQPDADNYGEWLRRSAGRDNSEISPLIREKVDISPWSPISDQWDIYENNW